MSDTKAPSVNPITGFLILAAALGPLAALSIGSKVADEETLARANAGLENAKPTDTFKGYDTMRSPAVAEGKTIASITQGSGVFSRLQSAIDGAGAGKMLSGEGPYTLFAPSDEAFARLPPERLQALMTDKAALDEFIAKHVVSGRLSPTELMQMRSAPTLSGNEMAVSVPGQIMVGDATVTKSIGASNGVVHVIDRVLM